MIKIGRPNIADAPSWYPNFFKLAEGDDLIAALEKNRQEFTELINAIPAGMEDFKYADDKWTIKQVFIHLADEERYYAYKSFCYSRQSNVFLEVPMSENYCRDFNAANRTLADIKEELISIRNATISLFRSMTQAMLDFKDFPVEPVYTARSLGWFAAGHNIHHCNIIREKYLHK